MASSARVVLIAVPRGGKARELAEGMVEARLAACVNLLPEISSVYRWKGKVRRDAESLLVIKTSARRLKALEKWVKARHPYETPEFLVLSASGGSRDYLRWLSAETA